MWLIDNFSNGTQMKVFKIANYSGLNIHSLHSHVCINIIVYACFYRYHALVKFLEKEATSIEPVKGIQEERNSSINGSYSMVWSNKDDLQSSFVIFMFCSVACFISCSVNVCSFTLCVYL